MEDFTYKNTKYRSAVVVNGMSMAGPRAHFRGMGLSNEELRKPFIGIINTHNEMHPGHVHLDKLAEQVKAGVSEAGGVPFEIQFPSATVLRRAMPECAVCFPAGK